MSERIKKNIWNNVLFYVGSNMYGIIRCGWCVVAKNDAASTWFVVWVCKRCCYMRIICHGDTLGGQNEPVLLKAVGALGASMYTIVHYWLLSHLTCNMCRAPWPWNAALMMKKRWSSSQPLMTQWLNWRCAEGRCDRSCVLRSAWASAETVLSCMLVCKRVGVVLARRIFCKFANEVTIYI